MYGNKQHATCWAFVMLHLQTTQNSVSGHLCTKHMHPFIKNVAMQVFLIKTGCHKTAFAHKTTHLKTSTRNKQNQNYHTAQKKLKLCTCVTKLIKMVFKSQSMVKGNSKCSNLIYYMLKYSKISVAGNSQLLSSPSQYLLPCIHSFHT